jgi:hypothetical protein
MDHGRLRNLKRQSTDASPDPEIHDPEILGPKLRRRFVPGPVVSLAVGIAADTVKVVETTAPVGVTVAGEKLHDAPAGKPEQPNETTE